MKICVVGAGAIGGYLAVVLARSGNEVTVIARGAHLAAISERGLRLLDAEGTEIACARVRATSSFEEAGPHDLVILSVKAHQVGAIASSLGALMHENTIVVPMQNGIPWWYFQRHGGKYDGLTIDTVDPSGITAQSIDPSRIIGCVVYPASAIVSPGTVKHIEGNRFALGELDGVETARIAEISKIFVAAGLKSPVLTDIRAEIWLKVWGSLSFNPISALTHATLVDLCQYPLARELARNMMLEAQSVAEKLDITLRVTIDRRIDGAERVGRHKTSMLQDVEAGRDPEIDALVGSVIELGRLTETPTPQISAVYACVKLLGRTMATEKAGVRVTSLAALEQMPSPVAPVSTLA